MKIKSSFSCDKFSARRMKFQIYLTLFSSLSLGIDKSSLSLLSFLRQLSFSEPPIISFVRSVNWKCILDNEFMRYFMFHALEFEIILNFAKLNINNNTRIKK